MRDVGFVMGHARKLAVYLGGSNATGAPGAAHARIRARPRPGLRGALRVPGQALRVAFREGPCEAQW